jgi:hypothetical protein
MPLSRADRDRNVSRVAERSLSLGTPVREVNGERDMDTGEATRLGWTRREDEYARGRLREDVGMEALARLSNITGCRGGRLPTLAEW